jgi:hypothetical protein
MKMMLRPSAARRRSSTKISSVSWGVRDRHGRRGRGSGPRGRVVRISTVAAGRPMEPTRVGVDLEPFRGPAPDPLPRPDRSRKSGSAIVSRLRTMFSAERTGTSMKCWWTSRCRGRWRRPGRRYGRHAVEGDLCPHPREPRRMFARVARPRLARRADPPVRTSRSMWIAGDDARIFRGRLVIRRRGRAPRGAAAAGQGRGRGRTAVGRVGVASGRGCAVIRSSLPVQLGGE